MAESPDLQAIRERAEAVAQAFHEAYERLAPSFGYETRRVSAVPWADVPAQNKALMVAVAQEVLGSLLAALTQAETDVVAAMNREIGQVDLCAAAVAEAQRLREALMKIAAPDRDYVYAKVIARAALAVSAADKETT